MRAPTRDQVMAAALTTVAALEIVNWRRSAAMQKNDGTISRLTRLAFRTDTRHGRATFLAALGSASAWFAVHVVTGAE